jgi:hypothetical protein
LTCFTRYSNFRIPPVKISGAAEGLAYPQLSRAGRSSPRSVRSVTPTGCCGSGPWHKPGVRPQGGTSELYDEGKHSLLNLLTGRGIRTLVTGIGGDEMVALTIEEMPRQAVGVVRAPAEWIGPRTRELLDDIETGTAPAAVVNEMTLLSMACIAPPVLRAGMWPVHPLADPTLIRFGEWLPHAWRYRKQLHRARLTRIGCDSYLTDPPLRENFEQVMGLGLRRYGVTFLQTMLDQGSPLIDGGYLNPDGLATTMARIAAGTSTPADHDICGVFVAGATLRSYGHTDSRATVAASARAAA